MQCVSSLSSSSCSITTSSPKFITKASWDTQQKQKLPYNRNAPRKLTQSQSPSSSPTTAPSTLKEHLISDLLKRTTPLPTIPRKIEEETYLGYERWLPTPPKVVKPRSVFNATTLAYIGDCIYE
ncbi:ribonuclease III, partial [Trifolium medium]|nr:ribonuclease III [Trifolium medium]